MEKLPTSAELKKDATVEELRLMKQAWVGLAATAGYPEILWKIVRWLGVPYKNGKSSHAGKILVFENEAMDTYIIGNEYAVTFDTKRNKWINTRRFSVWVKTSSKPYKNSIDDIVMNSVMVMNWEWFFVRNGSEEEIIATNEDSFFVHGNWILSLRNSIGAAQAAKLAHTQASADFERKHLLEELLVGVQV